MNFDLPTYQEYIDVYKSLNIQIPLNLTAKISLVRECDGVVYPTEITFKYSRWEAGEIGHFLNPEDEEESDEVNQVEDTQQEDCSLSNSDTFESINPNFSFDQNFQNPQYYQYESYNFNFHFQS